MRLNRTAAFLAGYRATGNITRAAEIAGISRDMHYRRMKTDPEYKRVFEENERIAIGVLEDEATRRAVEGVQEPVIYQGNLCYEPVMDIDGRPVLDIEGNPRLKPLVIRKYSDSLLQFLLRGARPEKYRERFQHTHSGDLNLKFKGSLEALLSTYRELTNPAAEEPKEA